MLKPLTRSCPVGRYAPSPTGQLHLGNIYAALAAFDDIRAHNGIFILRIEDTDLPRNVDGAEESIINDLQWMGVEWDEGPDTGGPAAPYRQSQRNAIYREALLQLTQQGLIYACTCSRKDLQSAASAPHGSDGPVYPGTCRRDINPGDAQEFLSKFLSTPPQQHNASLRIRTDLLPEITFRDETHGLQRHNLVDEIGDFVVLRRDSLWAYQFVCAVDDAMMGISRVVRGSDLLSSTPRQVAIMTALNLPVPAYNHIPLMLDDSGNRMSKRDGSQSLQHLIKKGLRRNDVTELINRMLKNNKINDLLKPLWLNIV